MHGSTQGLLKMDKPWNKMEFISEIMALSKRYHIHHPFHIAMYEGKLNKEQIQGWVLNRYYYQISIPIKDAYILAHGPNATFRRQWIQRIVDHDGTDDQSGGIEAWLTLAQAVGLAREQVTSLQHVLPGVRFAVDAYVNFVHNAPWQEAVCSSLTEMFAPEIHQQRLNTWPNNYPWIEAKGLQYFQKRLSEARRDVQHGLEVTLEYFDTAEKQQRALDIVNFKLDVLWSMLDAIDLAYRIHRDRT